MTDFMLSLDLFTLYTRKTLFALSAPEEERRQYKQYDRRTRNDTT